MDLEPLAAVIRDQNHRIEELAAAAAFWQVRAYQAEEQLKSLTAGTTDSDIEPEPNTVDAEGLQLLQVSETVHEGVWDRVRRFWSG